MEPVRTELTYSYEPSDFFEAATTVALRYGNATFVDGEVVLTLLAHRQISHEQEPEFTEAVRTTLRCRQLISNRKFSLTGPRITHVDAKGNRNYVMLIESRRLEIRGNPVDLRLTSSSEAVLVDSKKERIRDETALTIQLAQNAEKTPTLCLMLDSYDRSLKDISNALVHLYEVRDAMASEFGGEKKACKRLGIKPADWDTLRRLANHEPISEGRHRGKQPPSRIAAPDELKEARTIAKIIIESYAKLK
jgi:hypothetical protein